VNFRMIQKLEATTPACSLCHGSTQFIIGCGYQFLECHWCGHICKAPQALTSLIIAAYQIKVGVNHGKRLTVVPLAAVQGRHANSEAHS